MPATNPFIPDQRQAAGIEAAKLLAKQKPKVAPVKTSPGGGAARVAGTKVSGRGVTRTRGGSV